MLRTTDSPTAGGLFCHYDAALEVGEPTLKTSDATPEMRMGTPTRTRSRGPHEVMATAVLAAGTVRLLGEAVDAYNRRMDELNARWRAAKADDFGVRAASCPADATDDEVRWLTASHADRLLDAKLELLSQLEGERQGFRRELDAEIAAATERLAKGPVRRASRGSTPTWW